LQFVWCLMLLWLLLLTSTKLCFEHVVYFVLFSSVCISFQYLLQCYHSLFGILYIISQTRLIDPVLCQCIVWF
jgi:hypothetical protein